MDAETALYTELWRACAGPLVTVPREQDLVFYFPQGHLEEVFLFIACVIYLLDKLEFIDIILICCPLKICMRV